MVRPLVLLAAAAAIGCYPPSVTVTPLGSGQTYPPTPDSVEIALFTGAPECPHDAIATISAEGQEKAVSEAKLHEILRDRARTAGAHAVINVTKGNRSVWPGGSEAPGAYHSRSGMAVRFKNAGCTR